MERKKEGVPWKVEKKKRKKENKQSSKGGKKNYYENRGFSLT